MHEGDDLIEHKFLILDISIEIFVESAVSII